MIQDRLDQVKGTNESTLIGNSLVSLMHHDPGLVTILFWLHSLGMIRIILGSMIQDRLNQIKGTNESTLGHSVSLIHHDPSGIRLIHFGFIPWK